MKSGRWRSEEELEPMVDRVVANVELMQQFHAAIGTEKQLVGKLIDDVTRYANSIDPTFGSIEGTRIVVILARRLGHFSTQEEKDD
jgi:hypothetical protein